MSNIDFFNLSKPKTVRYYRIRFNTAYRFAEIIVGFLWGIWIPKNLIPKPRLVKMDFFQEYSRLGNPGYFFLSRMMNFGMMGQKLPLMEKMAFKVFDEAMGRKERKKTFYTWQAHCDYSKQVC